MESVQAYQASDGNIFKTIAECQEHEISLIWRERIAEFSKSDVNPYPSGAQTSMVRKIIVAWETYKTGA
jgi:hypothetical protein